MQETQVQSLSQEDTLEKGMAPTPIFLPGKSHGQRSLTGYSPWGHKESDMTEHAHTQKGECLPGSSPVSKDGQPLEVGS